MNNEFAFGDEKLTPSGNSGEKLKNAVESSLKKNGLFDKVDVFYERKNLSIEIFDKFDRNKPLLSISKESIEDRRESEDFVTNAVKNALLSRMPR